MVFQQNQQPTSDIDDARARINAMQMPNTDAQMQELAAQYPNVSAEDLTAHKRYARKKSKVCCSCNRWYSRPPITVPEDLLRRSFVDMMFNEFGDLFQKQDPDTVAAIITGIYLDKNGLVIP